MSHDQKKKLTTCHKWPRSCSPAADTLQFFKDHAKKGERVEKKLKLAREINKEKKGLFNRFLEYMEKRNPISIVKSCLSNRIHRLFDSVPVLTIVTFVNWM